MCPSGFEGCESDPLLARGESAQSLEWDAIAEPSTMASAFTTMPAYLIYLKPSVSLQLKAKQRKHALQPAQGGLQAESSWQLRRKFSFRKTSVQ